MCAAVRQAEAVGRRRMMRECEREVRCVFWNVFFLSARSTVVAFVLNSMMIVVDVDAICLLFLRLCNKQIDRCIADAGFFLFVRRLYFVQL